jgi:hypothetical protein
MHPIRQIKILLGQHSVAFDLKGEMLVDREKAIGRARGLHDLAVAYLKDPRAFIKMNQVIFPPDSTQIDAPANTAASPNAPAENSDDELIPEEETQPFDPSLLDLWDREWEGTPLLPFQPGLPF